MIFPNKTLTFKKNLGMKDEKIKKVFFYLADDREFNIRGKLIKKLNRHLGRIGTKYDESSLRAEKYLE